jgi:hypothetical protein
MMPLTHPQPLTRALLTGIERCQSELGPHHHGRSRVSCGVAAVRPLLRSQLEHLPAAGRETARAEARLWTRASAARRCLSKSATWLAPIASFGPADPSAKSLLCPRGVGFRIVAHGAAMARLLLWEVVGPKGELFGPAFVPGDTTLTS